MLRLRKTSISKPGTSEASALMKLCLKEHLPLAEATKEFLNSKPEAFYRFIITCNNINITIIFNNAMHMIKCRTSHNVHVVIFGATIMHF
jgi:hypothetical protein